MLETQDLILAKAKPDDWQPMLRNVWSRPESARYMFWDTITTEAEARARLERTMAFQRDADSYFVYEKATGEAIGFAGIENAGEGVCFEHGICLGPDYVHRGYGRQILQCLIDRARTVYSAVEFRAQARPENAASRGLLAAMGFVEVGIEQGSDWRDGTPYTLVNHSLKLG